MSDSPLKTALREARQVIDYLDGSSRVGDLRARLRVLEGAVAMLEVDPNSEENIERLARLVVSLRDEVFEREKQQRFVRSAASEMMD